MYKYSYPFAFVSNFISVIDLEITFTFAGEGKSSADWKHCEGEQGDIWQREAPPSKTNLNPAIFGLWIWLHILLFVSTFVLKSLLVRVNFDNVQVVYGITTGFGKFARTVIEKDKLAELQVTLQCNRW